MTTLLLLTLFLVNIKVSQAQIFLEDTEADLEQVASSTISFTDIDNDGDEDLMILGGISDTESTATLYINEDGNFAPLSSNPFEGVFFGNVSFGDVNGDAVMDVLITGQTVNDIITKLYINNNDGTFTEQTNTPFFGVALTTSSSFIDIDNDGDNDIILAGISSADNLYSTNLYINDGAGNFILDTNNSFIQIRWGNVRFADVDNDGDMDVMITGDVDDPSNQSQPFDVITRLYLNDGTGLFTEVQNTSINGTAAGDAVFMDVDNDNDMDYVVSGEVWDGNASFDRQTNLYINDGAGNFTFQENQDFEGLNFSSIAPLDFDNDGDTDFVITGRENDAVTVRAILYVNDGAGNFTEASNTGLNGVFNGGAAASDMNNDGFTDVVLTGQNESQSANSTTVYLNNIENLSIEENFTPINAFELYPNPMTTGDTITLEFANTLESDFTINLYDVQGRLVMNKEYVGVNSSTLSLTVSDYSNGMYFVEVQGNNIKQTKKLLINN